WPHQFAATEPLDLDILVLPEATLILVASVIEPLRAANRILGRRLYRWRLVTPDGASVTTTSGISISADGAFVPAARAAPLVVVASYNWERSANASLKRRLRQAGRTRAAIIGVEAGAWLLAAAGLLDGRKATTHWEDFDDFARRYPDVDLVRGRYAIDDQRITTGGALPTLDLMLELIRRRQGYSLALEVSKLFIYDPAGARELRFHPPSIGHLRTLDARVASAVRIMEDTIDSPLPLARLAGRVGLTARRLQSLFHACLGVGPHTHYLALRLNCARRLVIETRMSMIEIATAAGFNSPSAFSRCYRAHYGESPRATRDGGGAAQSVPLGSVSKAPRKLARLSPRASHR
ncbi:MAG: GlxA family transcriptional regulator, partial [Kiloniellaceae bacterium]